MSTNWYRDIADMHDHYGMTEKFHEMDAYYLKKLLEFRTNFLEEELTELRTAEGAEDVVDALIDLVVVAIGTLHAFDVNGQKAWDEVLKANMSKQVGIKEGRPNPLGLPDLMKPAGWTAPSHLGNHGNLADVHFGSPCEV